MIHRNIISFFFLCFFIHIFLIDCIIGHVGIFPSFFRSAKDVSRNCNSRSQLRRIKAIDVIKALRGGSSAVKVEESKDDGNVLVRGNKTLSVLVSNFMGTPFLEKKKKLEIPRNATVADLKVILQQKFPGNPPLMLQNLFFGMRKLQDDEMLGNITTLSPITILIDVISGTSSYNKTMTISQALNAAVSLATHQAYLGEQLHKSYRRILNSENNISDSSDTMETAFYRDMLTSLNETMFSTYSEDIQEALEKEKEPDIVTADTAAWRTPGAKKQNPLAVAFAKEFDMNLKSLKGFVYYSILLGVSSLHILLI